MRALVTGATGFVGSHLCAALCERGIEVTALHRKSSRLDWLDACDCSRIVGDVERADVWSEALEAMDLVFHVAGLTAAVHGRDFDRVNREGTRALVRACRDRAPHLQRFLHVSSLAAAGPCLPGAPRTEAEDGEPVTHYGRSKRAGEVEVVRGLGGIPWTIVRPPIVYGPRDPAFLPVFRSVRRGIAVFPGFTERHYSLIHVRDLVRGMIDAALAQGAAGEVFYLTEDREHGWTDVLDLIRGALRPGAWKLRIPMPFITLAAAGAELKARITGRPGVFSWQKLPEIRAEAWLCSSAKARGAFGFRTRIELQEGIPETARWYAERGWL